MTSGARAWQAGRAATILTLLAAAGSFFAATTFVSDDFLFLTFARLVKNPLVAFVTDQHGGEFYRPIPMTLWWALARVGGGGSSLPFAAAALALHALVALEVTVLAGGAGETKAVRVLAGIGFFLAPQCLDAAYWFSASTDLLATAATLGALIFLLRGGRSPAILGASVLCAALAAFSKESTLILAPLGLILLGARRHAALRVAPHAAIAVAFVVIRCHILRGWGGTGDARVALPGKLLQILSGLVHVGTGAAVWPEPLAWGLGVVALLCLGRHVWRDLRSAAGGGAWRPAAFTAIALLPLLGAEWAVGARYFYLPAVGVAWLGARCLVAAPFAVRALVLAGLVAASTLQGLQRHTDVVAQQRRIDGARRAVLAGLSAGHAAFHIAAGVKDLDLAVKESADVRRAAAGSPGLLVLSDVPASFVLLPSPVPDRVRFLLAAPPIPPSGAYRFGDCQVVGLARRGADPDLEDVVKNLPDLRFLQFKDDPGGALVASDVTDAVLFRLRRR